MIQSPSNIPCPLNHAAHTHPSQPAVLWGHRRITFLQLNQFVNTTVKALKERNLKAGSCVALIAENSVESIIILLSVWRLGAVVCPINPRFPSPKIATLLKKVNAAFVITDDPDVIPGIKIGIPKVCLTDLIVFDVKDSFYKNETTAAATIDLNQDAVIIFTSGTTAEPKAAVLTYGNLYFNALGSNETIKLAPGDRWILSLPLYHVSGLGIVMRSLIAGAAVVIASQDNIPKILNEGKATHVSMVATQLRRLFNDQSSVGVSCHTSVRAILLGGSAIPANLVEESLSRGLPVHVSYGLTEMGSQVATGRPNNAGEACAKVLAYREVTIIDREICVRGVTLFKGYLNGDQILCPLDSEGWFHTGDLGVLDDNQCLRILGRRDNMFISGGENIHPEEIEAALLKIDHIAQAIVVPREDPEFGHRPVAFIQWTQAPPMRTGEALQNFLAQDLPKFKIPVAFYPWPSDLPADIKLNRHTFMNLARALRSQ